MDTKLILEIVGYVGTILTIVSMLMASVVKLRVINSVSNIISLVYALYCGTYPIAAMNIALFIINVYSLYKLFKPEKNFELVVCSTDDTFIRYFLKHWKDDLKDHFPNFDRKSADANVAYIVCCNSVPAGVLMGKKAEDGTLDIALDYSTPTYRDCSVAQFLHSKLPEHGVNTLLSSQDLTNHHVPYLKKMNFVEKNGVYVKNLK